MYLLSINYVWLCHGPGPGLGSSLGCKWAWSKPRPLDLITVGLLNIRGGFGRRIKVLGLNRLLPLIVCVGHMLS